jgi:hypothetical protein
LVAEKIAAGLAAWRRVRAGRHPSARSEPADDGPDREPAGPEGGRDSANRFHNEVLLTSADNLDDELLGWLRGAYDLAGR